MGSLKDFSCWITLISDLQEIIDIELEKLRKILSETTLTTKSFTFHASIVASCSRLENV